MKRYTLYTFATLALLLAATACTQDDAGLLPEASEGIPTLDFTHRTARISLTLSGSTSDVSSVRLTNLSTADGNPGEIIAHHAGSGIIYEALVAPQSVASGTAFVSISTTGGKTYVYRMRDNAKWTAGKEYEYAITIE